MPVLSIRPGSSIIRHLLPGTTRPCLFSGAERYVGMSTMRPSRMARALYDGSDIFLCCHLYLPARIRYLMAAMYDRDRYASPE